MAKTEPFNDHLAEYEQWFIDHPYVFRSELNAIRKVMPRRGRGVEIGIGSGLFASKLGIRDGVEPSHVMREKAGERYLYAVDGIAEQLPYPSGVVDFALMVTTLCYVDDVIKAFKEVHRILRKKGRFLLGFVDKNSPMGKEYLKYKDQNVFYRDAIFFGTEEVYRYLSDTHFQVRSTLQTVFGMVEDIKEVQSPKNGYGEGSFVVIEAVRS
jgi:ubiquinone/menaquinone biosynthesis C-methylase UbiE